MIGLTGEQTTNYWDEVFEGNPGYYGDKDNPSRLEITKYIKDTDSVLDCGCGIGTLQKLLPENPYTGFDYSPRAVRIACKTQGKGTFLNADARQMKELFADNQFDVVVMRHFLENQEDWKEVVRQAFRICNKRVIINIRRPFVDYPTRLVEQQKDTWVWDINYLEFNDLARNLSVSVSYGKVQNEEFVVINKHLDEAVFDLDDECDELSSLPRLLELKQRFPNLKVTLFCIPSKCSLEHIKKLQQYDWIELAVHGWFHDTEHGRATECNHWTYEEAKYYLERAEHLGYFKKIFRPPGWQMNWETIRALAEGGWIICEHLGHDKFEEYGGYRYTTGHLMEVHGHTWECNGNGIHELSTTKCNFTPQTKFYFISEAPLDRYLPGRYQ